MTVDLAHVLPFVVETGLKATAILGLAMAASVILRRASAASRHLVWQYAVIAVLALTLASLLITPRWAVMPRLWPTAVTTQLPPQSRAEPASPVVDLRADEPVAEAPHVSLADRKSVV